MSDCTQNAVTVADVTKKYGPRGYGNSAAVILTYDRVFLSRKNRLSYYGTNHCRKITKPTVTKGLRVPFVYLL